MDNSIRDLERALATDSTLGPKLLRAYDRAGIDSRESRALRVSLGLAPNFVGLLVEAERSSFHRMTLPLAFGDSDVTVSIQAGPGHYCDHRSTILPYSEYSEWEIGFQRGMLSAETDERLGIYWESPEADWTVAGYVETAKVQGLVNYLYVEHGAPQARPFDSPEEDEDVELDPQAEAWLALGA